MGYLDIGVSSSQSIANKSSAGAGDFAVSGGGGKGAAVPWLLVGVAGALVVLLLFVLKGRR